MPFRAYSKLAPQKGQYSRTNLIVFATPDESGLGVRKPTPVDAVIGKRLRDRRLALGISARELGRLTGVSHQQLEKYESALSRITSGHLSRITHALGVSPSFLFDEATSVEEATGRASSMEVVELIRFLSTREGQDLNIAFNLIEDPKVRRRYLALVCAVSKL